MLILPHVVSVVCSFQTALGICEVVGIRAPLWLFCSQHRNDWHAQQTIKSNRPTDKQTHTNQTQTNRPNTHLRGNGIDYDHVLVDHGIQNVGNIREEVPVWHRLTEAQDRSHDVQAFANRSHTIATGVLHAHATCHQNVWRSLLLHHIE